MYHLAFFLDWEHVVCIRERPVCMNIAVDIHLPRSPPLLEAPTGQHQLFFLTNRF